MIIECPSGLAGEIRGMKGKEAQALADPAMARGGRNIDVMLQNCFLRIEDPGIYPWEQGSKPAWDDVLLGDRFAALIDIRVASWGPDYDFSVQCEACKERYEWELDLRDLPRRELPEATKAKLRARDNKFTAEGPGGEEVTFRLLYGRDEKAIDKLRRTNGGRWGIIDALAARILVVSGVKENPVAIRKWLDELDVIPMRDLLSALEEPDCGVETNIQTICTFANCRWEQDITLPFDKGFFYPRRKRTTTEETEPKTKSIRAAG